MLIGATYNQIQPRNQTLVSLILTFDTVETGNRVLEGTENDDKVVFSEVIRRKRTRRNYRESQEAVPDSLEVEEAYEYLETVAEPELVDKST